MSEIQGLGFAERAPDKFIIAERYVGTPWPKTGESARAIRTAREQYEYGKVELATRREGRMDYLYAIPRRTTGTLRPDYFSTKH